MNIPHEAQVVLDLVQKNGATDAIIAGGCLRDADNGKPINDIDVFVGTSYRGQAVCALNYAGYKLTKTFSEAYMTMDSSIYECSYFEKEGCLPVNVITVYGRCDMRAQLERFDYGICAIGYNGKNIITLPRYQIDKQNKTFTLRQRQTETQQDYSLARFDRLSQKYTGWTLKR